jgi:hypothetical protein
MELEQHLHEQEIHGDMKPLEFTPERVDVDGFPAELVAAEHFLKPNHSSNESETATTLLALNYSLRLAPLNGDCLAGWRFDIVEPRELLSLDSAQLQVKYNIICICAIIIILLQNRQMGVKYSLGFVHW